MGFGVRQHARGDSISKRAQSTTLTSLRFRINNLQSRLNGDLGDCDTSSNVSRSLTGLFQYSRRRQIELTDVRFAACFAAGFERIKPTLTMKRACQQIRVALLPAA